MSEEPRPLTTNGAMARARRRRIALLVGLSVLLAALAYAAYYYTQNHRAPVIAIAADATAKVEPLQYLYSFSGTGATGMNQPTGIAIIGNRCYVTDFAYHTVRAYSLNGAHLFDFGAIKYAGRTSLDSPVHLAVGPNDTIWVTDRVLRAIFVYDQDGKFVRTFVPDGDPKFVWAPLALTFDATGDLYVSDVADSANHRILVFGPDGKLKTKWGSSAQVTMATDSPGKFFFPNGIAVHGTGASAIVYVADGDNRRVQEFRTDGTFVRLINTSGTPRGLAINSKGLLFVVDALAHRVDMYDEKGNSLATFGENGTGPGQFNFPNDIAFDAAGRAYVVDRDNNQVQVWGGLVGQIPGVTNITPSTAWVPFVLIALLASPFAAMGLRRKRFMATPDFIDGMVAAGEVSAMVNKRYLWAVTEQTKPTYEAAVSDNVRLGELLNGEPHSDSDAAAIREKLGVTRDEAEVLALAKWAKVLCTENVDLARKAVALGVDVYDRATWLKKFGPKQ